MHKLLLFSIVLVTIAAPAWAARDPNAIRGVKKTLFVLAAFAVAWLLLVKYVYPKLYYPDL